MRQNLNHFYTRIINDLSPATRAVINKSKWKGVHNPTVPNYLKTSNYKLVHNVLPFQTKFCDFSLDNPKSFCVFCNKGPDIAFHVFKSCEKLTMIWQFIDSLIEKNHHYYRPDSTRPIIFRLFNTYFLVPIRS